MAAGGARAACRGGVRLRRGSARAHTRLSPRPAIVGGDAPAASPPASRAVARARRPDGLGGLRHADRRRPRGLARRGARRRRAHAPRLQPRRDRDGDADGRGDLRLDAAGACPRARAARRRGPGDARRSGAAPRRRRVVAARGLPRLRGPAGAALRAAPRIAGADALLQPPRRRPRVGRRLRRRASTSSRWRRATPTSSATATAGAASSTRASISAPTIRAACRAGEPRAPRTRRCSSRSRASTTATS